MQQDEECRGSGAGGQRPWVSPISDDGVNEFRKQLEAQTPLGRIGQTGDVAPAVVFLASDDAGWITGETLLITGGLR